MQKNAYCRCLYYSANALARTLTRLAEEAFAPAGLAPSQALILMAVNRQPGIAAGEIAAVMQLDPSTVTRLTGKLEQKGFVKRHTEGKYTLVYPLAPALALDATLRTAWRNLNDRYSAVLGVEESARLAEELYHKNSLLVP